MSHTFNIAAGLNAQDWQRSQEQKAVAGLTNSGPTSQKRISESAHAFESLLVSKWLEAAESSLATVPGGSGEEEDEATKQYSGMAVQTLGQSISAHGGVGIAQMLEKALSKSTVVDSK
jgi:Rod binding domain-containing protein